jgi:Domain of unknown function (DUF4407)
VSGYLWAVLGILGSLAMTAFGDMVSEEVRDRLDRVPHAILRLAARQLDADERVSVYKDEWLPELTYILKGDEARPITRLIIGINYAIGILVNTRRITRHLHRPMPGQPQPAATGLVEASAHSGFSLAGPQRLLVALAGARPDILDLCPSERIKFVSLGWSILITGSMAVVSMWFALGSAMGFNLFVALPAAILWGLIIVGIDRFLVTSLPVSGSRRFVFALPRLLLAILIGTTISTPLVLRIFQPEINSQIAVMKAQRANSFELEQQHSSLAQQVSKLGNVVSNLQNVIDTHGGQAIDPASDPVILSLTAQLNNDRSLQQKYYTQWQCQLYGGTGCPKGNGALAQASQNAYLQTLQEASVLANRIQTRETKLSHVDAASEQDRYQQALADLPAARRQLNTAISQENTLQSNFAASNEASNGLLTRLQALSQLSAGNPTVSDARFLLLLLFLMIEILPITVKLLQRPGLYERVLSAAARRELNDALQKFGRCDD